MSIYVGSIGCWEEQRCPGTPEGRDTSLDENVYVMHRLINKEKLMEVVAACRLRGLEIEV